MEIHFIYDMKKYKRKKKSFDTEGISNAHTHTQTFSIRWNSISWINYYWNNKLWVIKSNEKRQ